MAINMARADRRTDQFIGTKGTNEGVAPGSYNSGSDGFKAERERSVPFASGVDKVCCPNLTTSGYTPGPGHYVSTPRDEPSGLGQSTFKTKVARIGPTAPGSSVFTESNLLKNPGPGNYDTKTEWELKLKRPPRNASNPWREAATKTVPSIPPQKLAPGAVPETAMGTDISNMTMRHTGEPKDTTGPGEYDPIMVLTTPSQPQTSLALGGPRQDRPLWEPHGGIDNSLPPRENPGPGSYDTKKGVGDFASDDADKKPTYQFASTTIMPHQKDGPGEGKAAPGPGQYESATEIDKGVSRARAHSSTHGDRTRFGSSVQRIGWSRPVDQPFVDPYHIHHVPGPGSYPVTGGIFAAPGKDKEQEASKAVPGNQKKKLYGVHHPMIVMALQETQGPLEAFGSTDDRSCNKFLPQTTPAPWSYNKDEARGQSMASDMREKKKVGRQGAFGSLADRFYGSPLSGRDDVPDASFGETDDKGYSSGANAEPRSMFASQTPRMPPGAGTGNVHAVKVGHVETPAPDAYYVDKLPNYRSPFRHPRSDHLSFGSGQKRFDVGRDIFDGHTAPIANPAPGEYNLSLSGPSNGASVVKDKRRMASNTGGTTKDVGPGSYCPVDTPMLKKTFNVSTQAPVALGAPRKTPREKKSVVPGMFS